MYLSQCLNIENIDKVTLIIQNNLYFNMYIKDKEISSIIGNISPKKFITSIGCLEKPQS